MLKKLNESIAIANICTQLYRCYCWLFHPFMATLKPQSNGPLYSNTVIGTLAVDGWAVCCYIWYSEEEAWAGCGPAHAVPSSLYQM